MTSRTSVPHSAAASIRPANLPPLRERVAALRAGLVSPTDDLFRLEAEFIRLEPLLQSFVAEAERFSRLRDEAAGHLSLGPDDRGALFSLPVGIKDVFHVRGFPTQAGSQLPPSELTGDEGAAVALLKKADALILGKTVSTEFAYFAPGPTRNPRHPDHTPGGSSSGSAAAVAAGLCPLALGTQTIGSIIRPAAFCGVVGFKPSQGRIPPTGLVHLSPSLDQVGFFTNKPEEAVIAAQVLIPDWSVVDKARPPVLGVPEGPFLEKPDPPARSQFRSVLAKLSSGGYSLSQLPLFDDLEDISARHQLIVAAEAARVHSEWFSRYADRYHPRTADLIRRGQRIGDTEVMQSISEMGVWRARLAEIMEREGIDIWLSPAALGTAPLGLDSTGDPIMNLPWTQAGFPALTLPSGEDAAGLPYGLQLVGRSSADESLMAWAGEIDLCLRQEK